MTKEEYKKKLEELFYRYPPGLDRKRINEKILLCNEIYEYEFSLNRVKWLRQLAEEILVLIECNSIVPSMNDVSDLARGVYQLIFWLELKKELENVNQND